MVVGRLHHRVGPSAYFSEFLQEHSKESITPLALPSLTNAGLPNHIIQRRQPSGHRRESITVGLRWIVEATDNWLSNQG
jgi:hypothetical protein